MQIKLSKAQWEFIGKKAGWMDKDNIKNLDAYGDDSAFNEFSKILHEKFPEIISLVKRSVKYDIPLRSDNPLADLTETINKISHTGQWWSKYLDNKRIKELNNILSKFSNIADRINGNLTTKKEEDEYLREKVNSGDPTAIAISEQ